MGKFFSLVFLRLTASLFHVFLQYFSTFFERFFDREDGSYWLCGDHSFKYCTIGSWRLLGYTDFIKNHIFNKIRTRIASIFPLLIISIPTNCKSPFRKIETPHFFILVPTQLLETFGRQCTSAHQCSQDRAHVTVSTQVSARPCVTIVKCNACVVERPGCKG